MSFTPSISFVLATRNRCATTLETLARIGDCGLNPGAHEIFVVDNASTDGTPNAVQREFPNVNLITLSKNRGSVSKNIAFTQATGKYIVTLDDDSYPLPGSIEQMIRHFQHNPRLGAASFNVRLPSGQRECSAYPNVFIGCGAGIRRTALNEVGPLPDDFFMQAEEYDLSLRLLDAGWGVQAFDDIHVVHAKSPATRSSSQKMRLDVRNNLLLVARRFPSPWREPYLHEWMARYWAMAAQNGRRFAAARGFVSGALRHLSTMQHQPISDHAFETFARIDEINRRIIDCRRQLNFKRVLLIDWGKNMLAYRLACEQAGLEIVAIADDKLAGQRYKDFSVVTDRDALAMSFDGAIVANLSRVHAAARMVQWRKLTTRPVIDLFEEERVAVQFAAA